MAIKRSKPFLIGCLVVGGFLVWWVVFVWLLPDFLSSLSPQTQKLVTWGVAALFVSLAIDWAQDVSSRLKDILERLEKIERNTGAKASSRGLVTSDDSN